MEEIEVTPKSLGEIVLKAQRATPGKWLHVEGEWICVAGARQTLVGRAETDADAEYMAAASPRLMLALVGAFSELWVDRHICAQERRAALEKCERLEREAEWLAARVKCDNTFTPVQEAACVRANGPCAKCLREAAHRAVKETENAGQA